MRKRAILITGTGGEVGQALIRELAGDNRLVTLDLRALTPELAALTTHVQGDLLDTHFLTRLVSEYEIDVIYHLAALLSTRSEITPEMAHMVNVEGTIYRRHYRQLAVQKQVTVDFRCVRFPGLLSAFTLPTGGTSDFGPEMIHAAAKGEAYTCFVREDARIPFMAMPDAIKGLLMLADTPRGRLNRQVYNLTSFSLTAEEVAAIVREAFPSADITFGAENKRQQIVDTWPAYIDDSAARHDLGWRPEYDINRAFHEYLIPTIRQQYQH